MSNPSCFSSLSYTTCFDYKVVIISYKIQTYTTYLKDCWDFKHLKLRNENRYNDVCTCSVIPNSNSLTDTSCIHIPAVATNSSMMRIVSTIWQKAHTMWCSKFKFIIQVQYEFRHDYDVRSLDEKSMEMVQAI
jgi:hypothetical protein